MDCSSGCRRVRMLPPPVRLLCLWLCSEAVAAQLLWPGTKATFTPHYESAAAAQGNAQSRGWRTVSGEDNGETRGASARASWVGTVSPNSRFVRKSSARPESVRIRQGGKGDALRTGKTDTERPSGGGCSLDELLRQSPHGTTCRRTRRLERRSRTRRSGPTGTGSASDAVPVAMAQEQEAEPPFGLNSSDYEEEEYSLPDLPDSTSPERPRRKQLRNPFYPLTAESYGAYAVVVTAAFIFSAGVIGNVSVMCIVCHNYYMRSISNSLLANLALWDFIIIFFCLPLVVFHELTRTWLLGEFSCRIIPYLEVASLGVTTFTLCALCIDRFRAATNVQLYYEMIENWASTSAKLAVIWVGALLLALPELLIRQLVTEDGEPPGVTPCERCVIRISTELPDTLYVLGLTYDSARLWWYFGCYFCLPTLFTICSSLATARRIRRAERACVRGTMKQIQLESQMNCAVVALAILYGFCIIPENICNIIGTYMAAGVPRRTLDVLQVASQLLLFCKSAATPALLFCLCRPFTRAFLDCCCCCCNECGPPRSPAADPDEGAADLELSAFSSARREPSISPAYTAVGTHC